MNIRELKGATLIQTVARPVRQVVVVALGLVLTTASVWGQDRIRIVETTRTAMREKRPVVPRSPPATVQPDRPIAPIQKPAVYAEHFVTEMQDQYRTVYVPVIESQTEPTTAWWNPLGFSARTFQPRPVVRWEPRVEKTRVPVRYRELVSESTELPQSARSSATSNGSKAPAAASSRIRGTNRSANARQTGSTIVLPQQQFGGISRLESDQPRFGTRPELREPRVIR